LLQLRCPLLLVDNVHLQLGYLIPALLIMGELGLRPGAGESEPDLNTATRVD
jgi:hypothetical protein